MSVYHDAAAGAAKPAVLGVDSPYRGLRPFSVDDADYFFGRDADVKRTLAAVFSSPVTLLYGPSGVGKSSLINAGLLKEVQRRGDLIATSFKDWSRGGALAVIAGRIESANTELRVPSKPDDSPLDRISAIVAAVKESELNEGTIRSPIVLVLDQFEDYTKYRQANLGFDLELTELIRRFGASLSIIISIRQDHLSELDQFAPLIPGMFNSYIRVDHLNAQSATDAIHRPLTKWAQKHSEPPVIAEDELVGMILIDVESDETRQQRLDPEASDRDMSSARFETAYLQVVMERMWLQRTGNAMTGQTYVRLGTARQILRSHVEGEIDLLGEANQGTMARILPQLVTASGLKLAQHPADINARTGVPVERITDLLESLEARGRILRVLDPTLSDRHMRRFEPFHDQIAKALNDWLTRYSGRDEATEKMRRRLRNQLEASQRVLDPAARGTFSDEQKREQRKKELERSLNTLQALSSNPVDPAIALEAREEVRRAEKSGPKAIRKAAGELAEEFDAQLIGLNETGIIGAITSVYYGLDEGDVDKKSLEADILELADLTAELDDFRRMKDDKDKNKRKLAEETLEDLRFTWGEELWVANQGARGIVAPGAAEQLSQVCSIWGREPLPADEDSGLDHAEEEPWLSRPGRFILSVAVMGVVTVVGLAVGEWVTSWWLERSGRPELQEILWPWLVWVIGILGGVVFGLVNVRRDPSYYWGEDLALYATSTAAYSSVGWLGVNLVALVGFKTFDVSFELLLWPAVVVALVIWGGLIVSETT